MGVSAAKQAYNRNYYARRRSEILARKQEYYAENAEALKQTERERRFESRLRVFAHYGMECLCCGESHIECLTIDHINNDGAFDRKVRKLGGGATFYRWLERQGWPEGFRTLCHNCNCARHYFGECPHERERRRGY